MGKRGIRPAYRLIALLAGMAFTLVAIGGRLVQLQVVKASAFENLGSRQRVRHLQLPARRGAIFDRNGVPLAVSVDARAIYANPSLVVDPAATARKLAPVIGADVTTIKERISRKGGFVYLARKLDVAVGQRVLAMNLPGIGTLDETKRIYPQGALAGQVLGFVGLDDHGLSGIEHGFDAQLAGAPGEEVVEEDPQGRAIPGGIHSIRNAVRGQDLVLTIDRDVQFQAELAISDAAQKWGAKHSMAVVLDAQSNEILAVANWPPFDPNRFAEFPEDPRRNRAIQDAYEPGSVNKLVTAAAAVDSGLVRPSDMFSVPDNYRVGDHVVNDFETHPTWYLSYADILAKSSNIGTVEVAQKIGARRVYEMLEKFGYGHRSGVEFPGESAGISLPLKDWSGTSIATIPIGQGVAVSLLQMTNVYTTIARDGMWMSPRLVRSLDGAARAPAKQPRRIISPYSAAQLRGMLLNVVENGTGKKARIPGYLIGGKTGTANKPLPDRRGYSHQVVTTFMGMVPIDHPRFVVGVVMDEPSLHQAAATAAPAFQRITSFVLARWGVPPQVIPTGKDAKSAMKVASALAPPPAPSSSKSPAPSSSPKPAATASQHPSATPKPKPSSTSSASPKPKPSPSSSPAAARHRALKTERRR